MNKKTTLTTARLLGLWLAIFAGPPLAAEMARGTSLSIADGAIGFVAGAAVFLAVLAGAASAAKLSGGALMSGLEKE